ncbi:translation initiation factor eIF3 subunit g [Thelotrema lepadinum]|nr:translation initiation factor eIF3 subunit g [Thelotrema lepadinum]
MSKPAARDWADDLDDVEDSTSLPPQQITNNKDGTKTIVSYSLNEDGAKVKTTRRIRTTVVRETVNPRVAERRAWSKFGKESNSAAGPSLETTSIGENILFKPSISWRNDLKDDVKKAEDDQMRDKLRDKKLRCRICDGEHFTARCPFKDTMPPPGEGLGAAAEGADSTGATAGPDLDPEGKLGRGSGGYVPPHLRKGAAGATGEKMAGGSKYERDDLATLRVTNVSEFAEEGDLREIFERYGRVTRVFLAKDRESGRAKGFAFISYADRADAQRACDKIDGYGYGHLILRVEFAKRAT